MKNDTIIKNISQPHVADSGFYEKLNLDNKFNPVGNRHLEIVSDPQIKVFRDVLLKYPFIVKKRSISSPRGRFGIFGTFLN